MRKWVASATGGHLSWPSHHFQWSSLLAWPHLGSHCHLTTELHAMSLVGLLATTSIAKANCGVILHYHVGHGDSQLSSYSTQEHLVVPST